MIPGLALPEAAAPRVAGEGGYDSRPEAPEVVILHVEADEAFATTLLAKADTLLGTRKVRFRAALVPHRGEVVEPELTDRLQRATVLVPLLSSHFLGSDWSELLRNAPDLEVRLVLVLVRACAWEDAFGELSALPHGGVSIADHTSPDEAYSQVVDKLRRLLGEALSVPDPATRVTDLGERPSPLFSHTLEQVFPANRPSELTFVMPVEHERLLRELPRPDRGLVIEGPSRIGKTTAIKYALEQLGCDYTYVLPCDEGVDEIRRPESVTGWVIVDDFHELDPQQKKRISNVLKWMTDRPTENRKLIVIGVGEIARRLVSLNRGLEQRFDTIRIGRQPDAQVGAMLSQGEHWLNVVFEPTDALRRLSHGSLALAQQLAARALADASVRETRSRTTPVRVDRDALIGQVLGQMRNLFQDELVKLVGMDRDLPRPRGVYLALLWRLAANGETGVAMSEVASDYPQFAPAFSAGIMGQLTRPLEEGPVLSESVCVHGQRVTVVDPLLSLYLRCESFAELARAGGLGDTPVVEGKILKFRGPGHENSAPLTADAPLWGIRDSDWFWKHRHAERLVTIIADGYVQDIRAALPSAGRAGVPQTSVPFIGRAGHDVARDIVDLARRRGAMRRLLEELRTDSAIAIYWPELDEMLNPSTAPPEAD